MGLSIDVDYKEVELGNHLIYTIDIINQGNEDVKDIILDINITPKVSFVRGEIRRQRGILDFEEQYKGLIIGNLAPDEDAKVILEVKSKKEDDIKEIKCYGMIKDKALSNTVSTRVKNVGNEEV